MAATHTTRTPEMISNLDNDNPSSRMTGLWSWQAQAEYNSYTVITIVQMPESDDFIS
jgi:hypothetical protein